MQDFKFYRRLMVVNVSIMNLDDIIMSGSCSGEPDTHYTQTIVQIAVLSELPAKQSLRPLLVCLPLEM